MITVYATVPPDAAEGLARTVVEERLAACVNSLECQTVYRWDGDIVEDDEVVLLAKTTADSADRLVDRLAELHPYDVPCIEQFAAADAHPPFADWCIEETGK